MTDDTPSDRRIALVPRRGEGARLDRFLARSFPSYSRKQLGQAIRAGLVRVNRRVARPGTVLAEGDELELPVWSQVLPKLDADRARHRRQGRAPTEVVELYRDEDLLIVSKPAGVPVHGGARGGATTTLIDLLREDVLAGYGLVHRLDLDTTGAIALVRGDALRAETMQRFAAADGEIHKTYEAIVSGTPEPAAGVIDLPLAPPAHRGRARVDEAEGKPAQTRYATVESFVRASRLELVPLTGRTHQLRAHLLAIGHPLLVDPRYAGRRGWRIPDPRGEHDARLRRTPLHARALTLPHPRTGEPVTVTAPLPDDMRYALEVLRVVAGRGRKRGGLPPVPREGGPGERASEGS
jgi:23S rRNA pseudouridine955/2504/2580 synthase